MHGLLGGLVFAAIIGGFLLYAQVHLQESSGVIVAVLFFIYFLPALVAEYRHHRQKLAIGILTLVGGWTLIGWVTALVWACTTDVSSKVFMRVARDTPSASHGFNRDND